MTDQTNKDLPPLPKPVKVLYIEGEECPIFGRGQMHAYARAALSASAPTAGSVPSDLTADHIDRFEASLSDLGPATRAAASLVCALAKSALLAQYGSPAWQPIETAPHGENVLLSWKDWDGEWQFEVGPASWGWRTPTVSNMSRHGRATHWMSLPPTPQEGK